uniref:Uncharacterized protein n=1 Tax=Anopheles maculatus TaxID=74869 RepID=A0A182S6I7_9DIPT
MDDWFRAALNARTLAENRQFQHLKTLARESQIAKPEQNGPGYRIVSLRPSIQFESVLFFFQESFYSQPLPRLAGVVASGLGKNLSSSVHRTRDVFLSAVPAPGATLVLLVLLLRPAVFAKEYNDDDDDDG